MSIVSPSLLVWCLGPSFGDPISSRRAACADYFSAASLRYRWTQPKTNGRTQVAPRLETFPNGVFDGAEFVFDGFRT